MGNQGARPEPKNVHPTSYDERVLRAYRAFCAIGGLLAGEQNEIELVSRVCQVFVTLSGYRMAWIGYAQPDGDKLIRPVAYSGFEAGYLNSARITWADIPRGRGPTGTAVREKRPAVNQRVRTDPGFAPWREEAVKRGYESVAAFPLLSTEGTAFGALTVYAPEPDAFDHEEIEVISHLARLVAYGVLSIRNAHREKHKLSEARHVADQLQAVLDNMLEAVFVCDAEGHIVLANLSGLRLLGSANVEEARKYSWAHQRGFLPRSPQPADSSEPCPMERALKGEVVTYFQESLLPPGRPEIVASTTAAPIRNSSGKIIGAIKVVRDVTDVVEFEKMKRDFVESAAHELKTPVTAIRGYCQLLMRDQGALSETAKDLLTEINLGTIRIDRIIENLLDLSQIRMDELTLHKTPIQLAELVSDVAREQAREYPTHNIFVAASAGATVHGDRERLAKVLRNFIGNAVKYSPEDGDIEIRLEVSGPEAIVSVRDHGIGIPKNRQNWVFQQFYRAHANTAHEYGGLGIGLYLCRVIIEKHQGHIGFESEEGRGSTFRFSLPLIQKETETKNGNSDHSRD